MSTREVIHALWRHISHRDWDGLRGVLSNELTVHWPVTGERIVGPDNFVALNSKYPEGWSIEVRSIVASGRHAASEVYVPHVELGLFAVASFWTVDDGRVTLGVEYWTAPGSEQPPTWRDAYTDCS